MGKLIKEWVKGILTEGIEKKVVVYAGRFQPFHKGHNATYEHLVKQFGRDNVYIGTSNKTDNIKSPFKFNEKKMIMTKMFGISSNKIVQIKNPYAPTEIIGKFNKETTAFITVVGEKDRYRLKGKYFEPYHPDRVESGYKDKGYVYVAPAQSNPISGTEVRKLLSFGNDDSKKKGFKKAYDGKFNPKIYKFVTDKLGTISTKMESFLSTFDFNKIISEASATQQNKGTVDDGPGAYYGNSKSYKAVGDETARRLGWQVVDYILDTDEDSIYADDARGIEDKYPVSYFPSGKPGLDAQIRYTDLKGNPAYKTWAKHITKVATMVGYTLVDFLDAEKAVDSSKNEPKKVSDPNNTSDVETEKFKELKESLITEGGAYGHMNHPFDIKMNLTFGDLKQIIKGALNGKLELAREKTDGQALAVSWRDDKGLIAARNKGHLKNKGENALDISAMASKFGGRGGLTDAYNFAMRDLNDAIKSLSSAQRDKIFKQGSSFMNLEVIWPTSVNVVPYGQALLVFHNTGEFNDDGIQIGANTDAAKILAGMIKQINKNVTDKYTIQGPPVTQLPKNQELSKMQSKFDSQLKKVQSEFKLKDSDGVADYHQAWWEDWVDKNSPSTLDNKTKMGLVKRWAFDDKSFRLDKKNITDSKTLEWSKKIDKKDHTKLAKENTRKFEDIFLGVGAEVLSFMSSVLTVNPDKAVRDMKKRLDQTIKDVSKSGSPEKITKLKMELERLAAIGGKDKIVPNEGLVFVYKGDTYKLTGAFASLNQILGLMYF